MSRNSFLKFILFLFLSFFSKLWAKKYNNLHIKNIEILEDEVLIYFDKKLSKENLKTFELNDKKKKEL